MCFKVGTVREDEGKMGNGQRVGPTTLTDTG